MPFIGIVPPANRVQGFYGGASNASLGSAPLNNVVDATAQMTPGLCAWYKDSVGRISVLAYAQAQASIRFGAVLNHAMGFATTLNSAGVSTQNGVDTGFVVESRTTDGGNLACFAGVAAASVINTGYYFWRYISGYCPFAKVGSAIPSGNPIMMSASTAAVLGTTLLYNATLVNASQRIPVGHMISLSDNLDGSMASIYLSGWYC